MEHPRNPSKTGKFSPYRQSEPALPLGQAFTSYEIDPRPLASLEAHQDPLPNPAAFYQQVDRLELDDRVRQYLGNFVPALPPIAPVLGDLEAEERYSAAVLRVHRACRYRIRDMRILPESNFTAIPLGIRYREAPYGQVDLGLAAADRRPWVNDAGGRISVTLPDHPEWRRMGMACEQHFNYPVNPTGRHQPRGVEAPRMLPSYATLNIAFRHTVNEFDMVETGQEQGLIRFDAFTASLSLP